MGSRQWAQVNWSSWKAEAQGVFSQDSLPSDENGESLSIVKMSSLLFWSFKLSFGFQNNSVSWDNWLFYYVLK
jgi:hypothetical protein